MRYILILSLLISLNGFSQLKTYSLTPRGDTLNGIDVNGKKQGRWVVSMPPLRGEPGYEEQGFYLNDKKDGKWQVYSEHGDLIAIENYKWGNKHGKCIYFTRTGQPMREESWKAVNPENPYDTVDVFDVNDPTLVVDRVRIKLEGFTLKHGTWRYFEPDYGTVIKTEEYFLDKPKTAASGTVDDLAPIDVTDNTTNKKDTTAKKAMTKPQAILDYEKKNSGKKKIKVRDGRTGY